MRRVLISGILVAMFVSSAAAQEAAERTYAGNVLDANGRPLAGVKVNSYAAVPDPVGGTPLKELSTIQTAADGKFGFTAKVPVWSPVMVTARKFGLALAWQNLASDRDAGDVVLVLTKPAALSGVVVDEAGMPIPGATVHPYLAVGCGPGEPLNSLFGDGPMDWLIARTDANGRFEFASLPEDARAEFVVVAPGKGMLSTMMEGDSLLQYAPGDSDIKLTLHPEGKIEGTVAQKDGNAVAGATVNVHDHNPAYEFLPRSAVTGKDGNFVLAGLEEGNYWLELVSAKAVPDFIAPKPVVKVESGKTTSGVNLEDRVGGLLRVTVTDDKGKPVPGATVGVMMRTGETSYSGIGNLPGDEKGIFTARMDPGSILLVVEAEGFKKPDQVAEPITIEESKTVEKRIELMPLPRITGRALDPNGRPVEGALVLFHVQIEAGDNSRTFSSSIGGSTKTDANGGFRIPYESSDQPPQKFTLKVTTRHFESGLARMVEVENPRGLIEVRLKPGIVLSGLVTDDVGKPIPMARVEAASDMVSPNYRIAGSGCSASAVTDANGVYRIRNLPADKYTIVVGAEGFTAGTGDVALEEREPKTYAEKIVLKAAKLSITGIVTDSNAAPAAGAAFFVTGEGQTRKGVVRADKKGKFTIDKLVEGKVSIHVRGIGLWGLQEAKAGDKDVEIVVEGPGPRLGQRP